MTSGASVQSWRSGACILHVYHRGRGSDQHLQETGKSEELMDTVAGPDLKALMLCNNLYEKRI